MKKLIITSFLVSLFLISFSQNKQFELKDVYTNPSTRPVFVKSLKWLPNENVYSYVKDSILMEYGTKADKEIIRLSKINNDFEKAGLEKQNSVPQFNWTSSNTLNFLQKDTLYDYNFAAGTIKKVCYFPSKSEVIKQNPVKNNYVAFTDENNLKIAIGTQIIPVTQDKDKNIVSGQTVSRSEFGIQDGIFWSPKGNLLAYYTKDETAVGEYPIVNIDAREADVKMIKYPMAGMSSEVVSVNIFNPATKSNITLNTKEYDGGYLTNITWSPDEKYIYIQVLNREQNDMHLNKYNAQTGEFVKTLLEEKNDKWVEPQYPLYFLNNTSDQFVYMSQKDGYFHAYLYNSNGELIKQLTKGDWLVTSIKGFNAKNTKMYFMATKDSPIESHLYELDMKTLNITKITNAAGVHKIMLSDDKSMAIDVYSNAKEIAREYLLISTSKRKTIKTIEANKNPLKDYALGEMSIGTIKASDGVTDLYYRLIKPANFQEGKKYPVIVYVYGGPHAQMVTNSFLGGGGYFLQYLAAKGYVVFTVDNRGSSNRGFAFESVIHRQLGVEEMKDQMEGIKFLKSLNYVDSNRIGVNGWSFGGFMTTSLMLNHSDVFKVGVAGGPVIDWKYYEVMYGERYMDKPSENEAGYEKVSLLNQAKNLKGQLLIIHGTVDPTVVWQNSQLFLKQCVKDQVQVDYFIYPDHEHNVRGIDRLHLETKMAKYFDDFLKTAH